MASTSDKAGACGLLAPQRRQMIAYLTDYIVQPETLGGRRGHLVQALGTQQVVGPGNFASAVLVALCVVDAQV